MPRPVVADASALLPAWLPAERHQAYADLLIRLHAEGDVHLCAPSLLAHEILNALYLAVRGKAGAPPRLSEEGAAEGWHLFSDLRIELMAIDDIGARIIGLARALKRPSVYDVTYAALAERLGALMVTGDERFVNTARTHLPWVLPVWEVTSRSLRGKSAT